MYYPQMLLLLPPDAPSAFPIFTAPLAVQLYPKPTHIIVGMLTAKTGLQKQLSSGLCIPALRADAPFTHE